MMTGMQDPAYRETIESKLQGLKEDPELKAIMAEIETGGPAAMMKCVIIMDLNLMKCAQLLFYSSALTVILSWKIHT